MNNAKGAGRAPDCRPEISAKVKRRKPGREHFGTGRQMSLLYQRSNRGPSKAPTAEARPIPKLYQVRRNSADDSGQWRP